MTTDVLAEGPLPATGNGVAMAVAVMLSLWTIALVLGPVRVFIVAIFGNLRVVGYRHLPARQRQEKWEAWIALPGLAYVASLVSGVAASLIATGAFNLGLLAFDAGLVLLGLVGVFWGMQAPRGADLEDQKTPSTFLAELRSLDTGSAPSREVASRARVQIDRLTLESEPAWFVSIIDRLRATQSLTSRVAPRWGFKSWQGEQAQAIAVPRRAVLQVAARSKSLWLSVASGLAALCLAVTVSIQVGWFEEGQGVVADMVVGALLLAPIATGAVAARTSLIYRSRLWLNDREEVATAESIISRWEGELQAKDGPGRSVASRVGAALKVLFAPHS